MGLKGSPTQMLTFENVRVPAGNLLGPEGMGFKQTMQTLDGGRVVTGLLPPRAAWRFAQLERYGLLILIGVLFLVPLAAQSLFGIQFNPLFEVLWPLIQGLYGLILILTGLA